MAIPTLAVITLVLGLGLTLSSNKSASMARAVLYSTVYVFTAIAAVVALGHLRVQLLVFGPRGIPSFVDYSAELVQSLRIFVVVALWVIARALVRWMPVNTDTTAPVVTPACPSYDLLVLDQSTDIADVAATRSTAADTKARLAPKEDELLEVKGSLDAVKTHTETDVADFKAKVAARKAEVDAARQDDAAAADTRVELKHTVNAANDDAKCKTAFFAKESLAVSMKEYVELLKAQVEHLGRVVAGEKLRAECEQDEIRLAEREAAYWKAERKRLEVIRELRQKDKLLESRNEQQIAKIKRNSSVAVNAEDAEEVAHRKDKVAVLTADLKACNTDCNDLTSGLKLAKTAYWESYADVTELQEAIKVVRRSSAAAQGVGSTSFTSAARWKAHETRVRSRFAREHYAQMRVAMLEAKDKALLAAREEIVSLKEALQPEASSASATQSISVQTGKENIVPRNPPNLTFSSSSLSPLYLIQASAAVDFSEDTFPASAALTSGGLRPHLARLP